MQDKFEDSLIAQQLASLMNKLSSSSRVKRKVAEWIFEHGEAILGISIPDEDDLDVGRSRKSRKRRSSILSKTYSDRWDNENKLLPSAAWKELNELVLLASKKLKTSNKSQLQKNIDALSRELGFDAIETKILGLAVRLKCNESYAELCDKLFSSRKISINQLIAYMLNLPIRDVSQRLKYASSLLQTGIIKIGSDRWSRDFSDYIKTPDLVNLAIQDPNVGIRDIKRVILGLPCKAELTWSDYDHLKEDRGFIADIIKGAISENAKGINILLYGVPGTGKTELCKTIAKKLKLNIHSIGEMDEDGNEPRKKERLAALKISDHLLFKNGNSLLLFDEMEDLLENSFKSMFFGGSSMPKVFLNRLLENNSVPTFWTCNDIDQFDPALLRRMTLAIEIKSPPENVRVRIWKKYLKQNKVKITPNKITELAQMFECPPSLISNAVKSAKLANGGEEEIKLSIEKMALVAGRHIKINPLAGKEVIFRTELLNADQNLTALTNRIVNQSVMKNFSFCLYGPAGTGKSAYIRYLAKKMGMEVLQKRTSDLMSMWVGGTEKNIAKAFQEARQKKAFLIFDEADSLLRDRKSARQSWEVTQVNEMLTWMESHPLPFACTTNLMDNLDAASLRRFTFKVNCQYLTTQQTKMTFEHFFNLQAPDEIVYLKVLTPGDFAVVQKKAKILRQSSDATALVEMLKGECEVKQDIPSNPIGFNLSSKVQ